MLMFRTLRAVKSGRAQRLLRPYFAYRRGLFESSPRPSLDRSLGEAGRLISSVSFDAGAMTGLRGSGCLQSSQPDVADAKRLNNRIGSDPLEARRSALSDASLDSRMTAVPFSECS